MKKGSGGGGSFDPNQKKNKKLQRTIKTENYNSNGKYHH